MTKRIDLSLYEGHTKGDKHDPDSWRVVGDGFVMNGPSPQPRYIGYIRHSNFKPDIPATREPLSEADANLIADGPLLLAELKRMYERETELLTALQVIKEYTNESQSMDNIKEYVNNACDTNLPYWGCACQGPHTGPC